MPSILPPVSVNVIRRVPASCMLFPLVFFPSFPPLLCLLLRRSRGSALPRRLLFGGPLQSANSLHPDAVCGGALRVPNPIAVTSSLFFPSSRGLCPSLLNTHLCLRSALPTQCHFLPKLGKRSRAEGFTACLMKRRAHFTCRGLLRILSHPSSRCLLFFSSCHKYVCVATVTVYPCYAEVSPVTAVKPS